MVVAADRPSVPPTAPTTPLTAGMLMADEVSEADCRDWRELELPWWDATRELHVVVVTSDEAWSVAYAYENGTAWTLFIWLVGQLLEVEGLLLLVVVVMVATFGEGGSNRRNQKWLRAVSGVMRRAGSHRRQRSMKFRKSGSSQPFSAFTRLRDPGGPRSLPRREKPPVSTVVPSSSVFTLQYRG